MQIERGGGRTDRRRERRREERERGGRTREGENLLRSSANVTVGRRQPRTDARSHTRTHRVFDVRYLYVAPKRTAKWPPLLKRYAPVQAGPLRR